MKRLTGEIRYRVSLFNKLILQVEEEFLDGPNDINGLPEYLAGSRWRDAKVEDFTTTSQDLRKFHEKEIGDEQRNRTT